jgi:hypothetical protein
LLLLGQLVSVAQHAAGWYLKSDFSLKIHAWNDSQKSLLPNNFLAHVEAST